jgi:prepilin-type N-terminal cleavage/methylation domain-containing protein/prepilin-type processing-associated H-X9-DG protein
MRKKGFTLIELLVVIAIIAMLMAILMPALSKVKKIAMRVVCGTNLKGLGTAQTVYANDYDDEYVVQGRGTAQSWDYYTDQFQVANRTWADGQHITVGASLYLLVREADVSPKSFVCPASDQQEASGKNDNNLDIVELWDFGNANYATSPEGPDKCVSYSYHQPYGTGGRKSGFAADGTRSAAFAVMADRNPYFDSKITVVGGSLTEPDWLNGVHAIADYWSATPAVNSKSDWRVKRNNTQPHDRDSQNVLFADGHTENQDTVDIGVKNDNIYIPRATGGTETSIRQGDYPLMGTAPYAAAKNLSIQPLNNDDSYLVNDLPKP